MWGTVPPRATRAEPYRVNTRAEPYRVNTILMRSKSSVQA